MVSFVMCILRLRWKWVPLMQCLCIPRHWNQQCNSRCYYKTRLHWKKQWPSLIILIVHYGLLVVLYIMVRVDVQDMDKGKVLLSISFHGLLLHCLDWWIWDKQVVACSSQVFHNHVLVWFRIEQVDESHCIVSHVENLAILHGFAFKNRLTSTARVSTTIIALSSFSASFWPPKTGSSIKFECGYTSWLVVGLTAKK